MAHAKRKKKRKLSGPGARKKPPSYNHKKMPSFARSFATLFGFACGGEGKERGKGRRRRQMVRGLHYLYLARQVPIDRESDGDNCCLSHCGSQQQSRYPVLGTP